MNSLQWLDGDLVASFRGCSKVLKVDTDTGNVVWRLGRSMHDAGAWARGETSGTGPGPMAILDDPHGEFCGQHGAQVRPNGNLVLYDNGVQCAVNQYTGESVRPSGVFSRAVEYALDVDNGEAVFQRHHSLRGAFNRVGRSNGHVEVLRNGDWLISWGRGLWDDDPATPLPPDVSVSQVDPDSHEEKFSLSVRHRYARPVEAIRAIPRSPAALARRMEPLEATIVERPLFHTGSSDRPTIVIAFNQPIVDPVAATASVTVTGASATAAPHLVAGAAAHTYAFTLTPEGDGPIGFELTAAEACASGGICTAGGGTLSVVPAAVTIPGPVAAGFGASAYTVTEGSAVEVAVTLDPASGRQDRLEIPIRVQGGVAEPGTDFAAPESVRFGGGDTSRTFSFTAHADKLVEGRETVTIGFPFPLPEGVRAGPTGATTLTIADATDDAVGFRVERTDVAEGSTVALAFAAGTGIAFTTDQEIDLTVGGSAQPADYTIAAADGTALSPPYAVTLPAGRNRVSARLAIVDDTIVEGVESLTISAARSGESLGSRTIEIPASDGDLPQVSVYGSGGSAGEGDALSFTLTRTGATTAPLSATVSVTETGAMLAASTPVSATFANGMSRVALTVPTIDDQVVEDPSEVTVAVLSPDANDYEVGRPQAAHVTVGDDDRASLEFTLAPDEVMEGGSARAEVRITNGVRFATDQTVLLGVGGTAQPTDYALRDSRGDLTTPYALTLAAGSSSAAVTISALDDEEEEAAETVTLTASHGGVPLVARQLTIAASDSPPEVSVAPVRFKVVEGGPAAFAFSRLNATEPSKLPETAVPITIVDSAGRLDGTPPTAVSFAAGETIRTLQLNTTDDNIVQTAADEVIVTASPDAASPPAYRLIGGGTAPGRDCQRRQGCFHSGGGAHGPSRGRRGGRDGGHHERGRLPGEPDRGSFPLPCAGYGDVRRGLHVADQERIGSPDSRTAPQPRLGGGYDPGRRRFAGRGRGDDPHRRRARWQADRGPGDDHDRRERRPPRHPAAARTRCRDDRR